MNQANAISASIRRTYICGGLVLLLAGCTTPPSVAPLLRVAERAMQDESRSLATDLTRDLQGLEERRAALEAAFEADLQERATLDPPWVREATSVYVAAREALGRHEANLREERSRRADNLQTAAQAQRRALELLERQDQLLDQAGLSLWRLSETLRTPNQEIR